MYAVLGRLTDEASLSFVFLCRFFLPPSSEVAFRLDPEAFVAFSFFAKSL